MREFWRLSLAGIETYANAAYGGNFENLSAANQTAVPHRPVEQQADGAQFSDILPSDFAYELFFMTWAGFAMDPVYGGNKNMVGWSYTGFNGVNQGNFYGEGITTQTDNGQPQPDHPEASEPRDVPEGVPIGADGDVNSNSGNARRRSRDGTRSDEQAPSRPSSRLPGTTW